MKKKASCNFSVIKIWSNVCISLVNLKDKYFVKQKESISWYTWLPTWNTVEQKKVYVTCQIKEGLFSYLSFYKFVGINTSNTEAIKLVPIYFRKGNHKPFCKK